MHDTAFRQQILDQMINTRLQIHYARQSGLEIEEWMVDKAMENMAQKSKVTLSEFREKMISDGGKVEKETNILTAKSG